MGCDFAKYNSVNPETSEDDGVVFSDTQIDTIKSTWPLLSRDCSRVGIEVFMRIFRETPSSRKLFDSFGYHEIDNLHQHPVFCEHAQKFMAVLESVVEQMEKPEMIQPHLVALGARHAAIEGYQPGYFRFYRKCLLEVWEMELGEEFIQEVKDSWKRVIDYIVRCMAQGYDISMNNQLEHFIKGDNLAIVDQT